MYLKNAQIWTGKEFIPEGWVKIENGIIKDVGKGKHEEGKDLKGKILMPSFVNTHSHLYSTLFRGAGISILPSSFNEILSELWWKWDSLLDEETIYYSALVGGVESLKAGITTLIDHHASYGFIKGSLKIIEEALVERLGMRADLCFEISDRMGEKATKDAITENLEFIEYVSSKKNPFLSAHIGMHASFTISSATLEALKKEAPESAAFHIHVAEGVEDEVITRKRYNISVIERLSKYDILKKNTIVVHGIHLNEIEKELIKKYRGTLVHTPQSNMNNAVGCINLKELIQKGINVSIGTDGYSMNILNELRTIPLLQKHNFRDFNAIDFNDIVHVWENGYTLTESLFNIKIGKIEPGHIADLIVADYSGFTPINSENFMAHLIYGMTDSLRIDDVYINGRKVISNGQPTMLDYPKIQKDAKKVAGKIWKRMKEV